MSRLEYQSQQRKYAMHRKLIVLALGLALTVNATPGHAFGLGKLLANNPLTGGGGGNDVGSQVTKFQESAALSNSLMANSSVYLLRALSSKERGAELQKQLDTVNQLSDPKEKNAELAKLVASSSAELATLEQNEQTQQALKQASTEKKKAIGGGLFNLALALYQVNQLTRSGSSIISGVTNSPLEAYKVIPVKDTLPLLSALAGNGKTLMDTSLRLAKAADIKPELPTSGEVKPQELSADAFE